MQAQQETLSRDAMRGIGEFVRDTGRLIKPLAGKHSLSREKDGSLSFRVATDSGETLVNEKLALPGDVRASIVEIPAADGKRIPFLALERKRGEFALQSEDENGRNEVLRCKTLFIRPAPAVPLFANKGEITFKCVIVEHKTVIEAGSIKEILTRATADNKQQ